MDLFLQSTPVNALIVAPLKLASNIPAFSYRSVLISSETNIPFHIDYYKEVKARTKAIDLIYHSKNNIEVKNIIQKYNIQYIIIDRKENKDTILYDMFAKQITYSTKRFVVIQCH